MLTNSDYRELCDTTDAAIAAFERAAAVLDGRSRDILCGGRDVVLSDAALMAAAADVAVGIIAAGHAKREFIRDMTSRN